MKHILIIIAAILMISGCKKDDKPTASFVAYMDKKTANDMRYYMCGGIPGFRYDFDCATDTLYLQAELRYYDYRYDSTAGSYASDVVVKKFNKIPYYSYCDSVPRYGDKNALYGNFEIDIPQYKVCVLCFMMVDKKGVALTNDQYKIFQQGLIRPVDGGCYTIKLSNVHIF